MFSRGKLLCELVNNRHKHDTTSEYGYQKEDFQDSQPSHQGLSSKSCQNLDMLVDSSEVHNIGGAIDYKEQRQSSSMLSNIFSNEEYKKNINKEYQKEDPLFLDSNHGSFLRPCQDLHAVTLTEVMQTVSDATNNDAQPSTSAFLTDISNNLVPSTSFHHTRQSSDDEYIPNTDEDSTDYEETNTGSAKTKQRQITAVVSESDRSSFDDLGNARENGTAQSLNNTSTDIQSELTPHISKTKSRKRTLNKSQWQCNLRKKCAITGQSYTSKKGKVVPEKKMKPVCSCRLKCSERIDENIRQSIYQNYYAEGMTWDLKRQFIVSRVSEVQTARSRRRDPDLPPKRAYTLNYTFLVSEKLEKVCKKYFLNTLAISETVVRNAIKKSTHGFVQADRRGRHPPPNKTSEIVKETVRKHIGKVPRYESHYSRNRTKRLYLGSHLNIDKLYSLYLEFCAEEGIPKENMAKAWLYRHIFNTEFNLGFSPPANDTCDDCDMFIVKYKNTTDETEKNNLKALHNKHLEESSLRYNLKGFDKVEAIESQGVMKMLTVDLQKCLPTPYLTNGQSFYYRKLWTFNFTIMDSVPKESWCFMWDETVAGRGGNEMASGIVKFFEQLNDSTLKEVTIWSDNCAGQNKNIYLMMAYLWILSQKQNVEVINHKYLLKGHTHMEVDVVHSIIEREKKKIQEFPIVTPWDWQQFIKSCSRNSKIKVVNMETDNFLDFSPFFNGSSAPFVHRKKSNAGESVPYSAIVWMQFRKNEIGSMFYKTSFDQDTFEEVSFVRNKRRGFSVPTPKPIRDTRKPISRLKYNDLQKSLQWIPSMFHDYYRNLQCADVPDLPEAEAYE